MNSKPYQAIVVTGKAAFILQRLKDRAEQIFPWVSELSKFGNGTFSFFVPPFGLEGKAEVDEASQLRDDFIDWLRSEDVEWAEVNYGDSSLNDRVTRSSRIAGLADNLSRAVKIPNESLSGDYSSNGERFTVVSTAPSQSKLSEYVTESIARRNAGKIATDMAHTPTKDLVDVLIKGQLRTSTITEIKNTIAVQVPIVKGAVKALNREQSNYFKLLDEASAEIEQRLIAGGNVFNLGYKHYDHKNLLANTPAHNCESLLFRPTTFDGGIGTIVVSSVCEKVITIREQDFVNAVVIIQWLTESDCWACDITASDIAEMKNLGALVYLHGEFGPTEHAGWVPELHFQPPKKMKMWHPK